MGAPGFPLAWAGEVFLMEGDHSFLAAGDDAHLDDGRALPAGRLPAEPQMGEGFEHPHGDLCAVREAAGLAFGESEVRACAQPQGESLGGGNALPGIFERNGHGLARADFITDVFGQPDGAGFGFHSCSDLLFHCTEFVVPGKCLVAAFGVVVGCLAFEYSVEYTVITYWWVVYG